MQKRCHHAVGRTDAAGQVGYYNISGLAWSGRGKVKRVDAGADGGRNWRNAQASKHGDREGLDALQHRSAGVGGESALVEKRAIDDTGYVQPIISQLHEVRGTRSIYHNNAMQSWLVSEAGDVSNVQVVLTRRQ